MLNATILHQVMRGNRTNRKPKRRLKQHIDIRGSSCVTGSNPFLQQRGVFLPLAVDSFSN